MRITNRSGAPQGIRTATGLVWIEPGATRDLDVPEKIGEGDKVRDNPNYTSIVNSGIFEIDGVERKMSSTLAERNASVATVPPREGEGTEEWTERMTDYQRNLDAASDELESVRAENEQLKSDLTVSASRISELESQLSEKEGLLAQVTAERDALRGQGQAQDDFQPGRLQEVTAGLDARHKGAGSYSVFSGDDEVLSGLKKIDVDEFDALENDRQKTDWVNQRAAAESQGE